MALGSELFGSIFGHRDDRFEQMPPEHIPRIDGLTPEQWASMPPSDTAEVTVRLLVPGGVFETRTVTVGSVVQVFAYLEDTDASDGVVTGQGTWVWMLRSDVPEGYPLT